MFRYDWNTKNANKSTETSGTFNVFYLAQTPPDILDLVRTVESSARCQVSIAVY